jgi:hypothetical protein
MPQVIYLLNSAQHRNGSGKAVRQDTEAQQAMVEFGTVMVFTCSRSCSIGSAITNEWLIIQHEPGQQAASDK